MLVFLDSNIFYNNWYLRSVNFQVLFNYIINNNGFLLLSELVIQETENNQQKALDSALAELQKALNGLKQFSPATDPVDLKRFEEPYDFKALLENKLGSTYTIYLGYADIPQKTVVERAIKRRRPFKDGEKGYRDSLVWLSLLHFLAGNKYSGELVFINNNVNDFFSSTKDVLHEDLLGDLAEYGVTCRFITYPSLNDFVSTHIDKAEYTLNHNQLQEMERQVEWLTESYFSYLSTEALRTFLKDYDPVLGGSFSPQEHSFNIDEGMEDPEILKSDILQGPSVYINLRFWLRMCTFRLKITAEEYYTRVANMRAPYNIIEQRSDLVTIEIYLRINMQVSFEFIPDERNIKGFTVDQTGIRRS